MTQLTLWNHKNNKHDNKKGTRLSIRDPAWIILLILFTIISVAAENTLAPKPDPPNIVLILSDDLGYGDTLPYGVPSTYTPNINNLANQGVRFTQFYSAAPVCSPSRAALLTGRLPVRTGVYASNITIDPGRNAVFDPNAIGGLPLEEVTIAEALKFANYTNYFVGKWHLGQRPEYWPSQQGFDHWYGTPYTHGPMEFFPTNPNCSLIEDDSLVGYLYEDINVTHLTQLYTTQAVNYLKEQIVKATPFFLVVSYDNTHTPLYYSSNFNGSSLRGPYGDAVQETDWGVGQIMNALKLFELDDNTIIMYTSDNGPALYANISGGSAGPFYGGKGTTFEGGIREPFIVSYPNVISPSSFAFQIASMMDIFPTLLDFAGVPLPSDITYDGYSLRTVLTNNAPSPHEALYHWRGDLLYALRYGEYKAHFYTEGWKTVMDPYTDNTTASSETLTFHEPPLLFNINYDPAELFPLGLNATDYADILDTINTLRDIHLAGITYGQSQLNECNQIYALWSPMYVSNITDEIISCSQQNG